MAGKAKTATRRRRSSWRRRNASSSPRRDESFATTHGAKATISWFIRPTWLQVSLSAPAKSRASYLSKIESQAASASATPSPGGTWPPQ